MREGEERVEGREEVKRERRSEGGEKKRKVKREGREGREEEEGRNLASQFCFQCTCIT